jgi:hypothetical protein
MEILGNDLVTCKEILYEIVTAGHKRKFILRISRNFEKLIGKKNVNGYIRSWFTVH